ncbi:MAG: catalase [Moraxellaceae bacterium]|nr:catalase [Moraxellaceae bacterium]
MTAEAALEAVQGLQAIFGHHEGSRPVHAHGLLLQGVFTATPAAARLTRAAHMQGSPVPVTARFSNGNGHPAAPDFLPDVRGFSVSFHLANGQRSDIVAATLPRSPVRTPASALALVRALRPRLTLPLRFGIYALTHPEFLRTAPANLRAVLTLPASYASTSYHALHAYKWLTPYGSERFVRYRWVPEQRRRLAWWRALRRGRRYLQEEIAERLREGPVRMHLQVQVARPGDAVDDASAPWPADREVVTVGTLELQAPARQGEAEWVFDPLRLTDGIEPSRDPLLQFRTQVYAASAEQRGATHRPQHIRAA